MTQYNDSSSRLIAAAETGGIGAGSAVLGFVAVVRRGGLLAGVSVIIAIAVDVSQS